MSFQSLLSRKLATTGRRALSIQGTSILQKAVTSTVCCQCEVRESKTNTSFSLAPNSIQSRNRQTMTSLSASANSEELETSQQESAELNKLLSNEEEDTSHQEPAELNKLLKNFNLYGWQPDMNRSIDENYMELVLLVTRSSVCLQGSMACILVDPSVSQSSAATMEELERRLYGAIIGIATNKPLYSELDSDVHAEIGALGLACRLGNATEGCTAYITMPPCKHCFAAMLVSGVKRIVSRRRAFATILHLAQQHGIDMVELVETTDQVTKIQVLTQEGSQAGKRSAERQAEIHEARKRRKAAIRQKKSAKKR